MREGERKGGREVKIKHNEYSFHTNLYGMNDENLK